MHPGTRAVGWPPQYFTRFSRHGRRCHEIQSSSGWLQSCKTTVRKNNTSQRSHWPSSGSSGQRRFEIRLPQTGFVVLPRVAAFDLAARAQGALVCPSVLFYPQERTTRIPAHCDTRAKSRVSHVAYNKLQNIALGMSSRGGVGKMVPKPRWGVERILAGRGLPGLDEDDHRCIRHSLPTWISFPALPSKVGIEQHGTLYISS